MLTVSHLRKSFGELVAVNDVCLEIRAGETFGLLGPNGAGKTTTIQMITGVLSPDDGTIDIKGLGDPSQSMVREQIGLAPQALSLYENLTAAENLDFFGRLYGLRGNHLNERIDHCLEFAKLTDRRNGRVQTFSGGMKRRLNLACALVHEPKLVIMDEPTVGVDPQSRNHIFESIEQLQGEGCTIIYTTHYMEEAQRLCSRIAIMDHGKILALDSLDGLISSFGRDSVVQAELQVLPEDAEALPGKLEGNQLRFESTQPLDDVAQLVTAGVKFQTLQINQPDLESVFLSLTGRSLRDE